MNNCKIKNTEKVLEKEEENVNVVDLQKIIDGVSDSSEEEKQYKPNILLKSREEESKLSAIQKSKDEEESKFNAIQKSKDEEESKFNAIQKSEEDQIFKLEENSDDEEIYREDVNSAKKPFLPSAESLLSSSRCEYKNNLLEKSREQKRKFETKEITRMLASKYIDENLSKDDKNKNDSNNLLAATNTYYGLPMASWRVPLTGISEELLNKKQKTKEKTLTTKEKEKLKRAKGQSTHDSWKSEEWMRLRQTYD